MLKDVTNVSLEKYGAKLFERRSEHCLITFYIVLNSTCFIDYYLVNPDNNQKVIHIRKYYLVISLQRRVVQ